MWKNILFGSLALCLAVGLGCSSDTSGNGGSSSSASAGSTGSSASSGGGGSSSASAGSGGGGGTSSASESCCWSSSAGSTSNKAGSSATGGKSNVGGSSTAVDSTTSSGGKGGTGGSTAVVGGSVNGGSAEMGGTSKTGGTTGQGGTGGTSKTGGTATGGSATGGTATGGTGGSTSTGAPGGAKASDGCGKTPSKFKSAAVGQASPVNTVSVGGKNREFLVRWPSNYDNSKPYWLHFGLHGAGGNLSENGKDNFGLWSLSKDTTIFVTLAAVSGSWDFTGDLAYADEVLKQVENELCIDTSKIMLEGFSMGGAMSWVITCSRPNVYRAVVGHSAGAPNFTAPTNCSPVAYLGSLGLTDIEGNSQATQTDRFAKVDGCTMETLPTAPKGGHICTPYKGCLAADPVVWCSYDGGHGFTPTDSGASKTWVPAVVWEFLSKL